MPINDFIIPVLNLTEDMIDSIDVVKDNGILTIFLKLVNHHPECPFCGGPTSSKGLINYHFSIPDVAGFPANVHWKRRRYVCKDCHRTFSEVNPFTPGDMHASYSLMEQIIDDLKRVNLTMTDIAHRSHLSVPTIELYTDSFLRVPRQYLPENLGIDEIHSDMAKYGSKYLCVMVDNKNRNLIEILPSRSKNFLSKYFESIPENERKRVLFVTIDMWEPYKEVVQKYLKNAEIAVDPFHVIEYLCSDFTRLRIDIMNSYPKDSAGYYLLKHWHKLLMDDRDLDNEPQYNGFFKQKLNYRDLYNLLLELNPDLTLAYQLKERYRMFNKTATFEEAPAKLDQLKDAFVAAELPVYDEFIGLLTNWRQEIINSFHRPYDDKKQSNALSEYFNRQLGTLIVVSNGYANFERFRARAIYALNRNATHVITSKLHSNKRIGVKINSSKK